MEGTAAQEANSTESCTHEHHGEQECCHPKPTLCIAKLQFEEFEQSGWKFYHSNYPMFSAKQLDLISDTVGTMSMPEVFYGFNHLYIASPQNDILLEFSPVPALSLAAFAAQKAALKSLSESLQSQMSLKEGEESKVQEDARLNLIDMVPALIEVKEAHIWKKKDMSKVKDFKQIEIISDWTYSTAYKGNVHRLSRHAAKVKIETSLEIPAEAKHNKIRIEEGEFEIPLAKLGRDNPILHFTELYLYEDDLGDQGYTCDRVRFRVMADCFFLLHRYYLRVDEVVVRILDTRYFHAYDTNYIIREFQYKESTFNQLRAKGFKVNSEWSLSKTQADEVFPSLELKMKTTDKIVFE